MTGHCPPHLNAWTDEARVLLADLHAAGISPADIGSRLGRSENAVRLKICRYDLKAGPARDVPGYLSAMQVAREYHCPLSRVHTLIATGGLPAFKVKGGHYWRVNPIDIKGDLERKLRAPKRRSYKTSPPDVGDYYQRYSIRRLMVGGVLTRVTVTS